ncbi:MAG: hypothetical protein ACRD3E_00830 [Terriglobales bacterium]
MATAKTWLELLATAKAVFDTIKSGIDFGTAYEKHRNESDTRNEAQRVSVAFSTYSDDEVNAILARLQDCRARFITEGSGPQRQRCFCSVFLDVAEGNGGVMPEIDDWRNMFDQFGCSR